MNIEKNVPLPSRNHTDVIREMQPGDSVVVPSDKIDVFRACANAIGKSILTRKIKNTGDHRAWLKVMLLALCSIATSQADVTVAWDASPSPGIASYRVYDARDPLDPGDDVLLGAVDAETFQYTIVTGPVPVNYTAVTAVNEAGLESVTSEVLSLIPPSPPTRLRIIIQTSADLKVWADKVVVNDVAPESGATFWRAVVEGK